VQAAMREPASRPRPVGRVWRTLLIAAALTVSVGALARLYAESQSSPAPKTGVVPPSPLEVTPAPSAASLRASAAVDEQIVKAPIVVPQPEPAPSPGRSAAVDRRAEDVSGLLEKANALRGEKQWREAAAAYAHIVDVAPQSSESQAARVAAAQLRLDHLGDMRGAERLFREATQHGGPLIEEAAWGLVDVRRAQVDVEGERNAIAAYLARFPSGAMAPNGRARLAELSRSIP